MGIKTNIEKEISLLLEKIKRENDGDYSPEFARVLKSELQLVINKIYPELNPEQTISVLNILIHIIYMSYDLVYGEIRLIHDNDLTKIITVMHNERIANIFSAEILLRKKQIKNWEIDHSGVLLITPLAISG